MGAFLDLMEKIEPAMVSVSAPQKRVALSTRLLWTGLVLLLYLVMSNIELYGIPSEVADPFRQYRIIMGGARGTLTELGIGPIVTGGLIVQLLVGSGIISYDRNSERDARLLNVTNKLFSMVFVVAMAVLYVVNRTYGELSPTNSVIVVVQLILGGVSVILMDEVLQRGWGLGSGINLFILSGVTKEIFVSAFSLIGPVGDGKSYGSIVALVEDLLSGTASPQRIFMRDSSGQLPTIFGLLVTLAFLALLIYLENVSVQVPISSSRFRGFSGRYPIKLIYLSTLPVILVFAIISNFSIWAHFVQGNEILSKVPLLPEIIGRVNATSGEPLSGLVYYATPVRGFGGFLKDPVRFLGNFLFIATLSVLFSVLWVSVSGMDARSVASQLEEAGVLVRGFRSSTEVLVKMLGTYISTVTLLSGLIVAAVVSFGDLMAVYSSGVGILLAVGIVNDYYEAILREQLEETYPVLRRLIPSK